MPWNTAAAAVTTATPYTDAVSSATPLAALRLAENAWQRSLNIDLPSLSALFWGNVGGSLSETCTPALLLGGVYLIWRGHIDWRIPSGYIGTVVAITAVYGWLREYPAWFALYHLLAGGLIIGAFFIATDWVTSPITKRPADLRARPRRTHSIDPPARRLCGRRLLFDPDHEHGHSFD